MKPGPALCFGRVVTAAVAVSAQASPAGRAGTRRRQGLASRGREDRSPRSAKRESRGVRRDCGWGGQAAPGADGWCSQTAVRPLQAASTIPHGVLFGFADRARQIVRRTARWTTARMVGDFSPTITRHDVRTPSRLVRPPSMRDFYSISRPPLLAWRPGFARLQVDAPPPIRRDSRQSGASETSTASCIAWWNLRCRWPYLTTAASLRRTDRQVQTATATATRSREVHRHCPVSPGEGEERGTCQCATLIWSHRVRELNTTGPSVSSAATPADRPLAGDYVIRPENRRVCGSRTVGQTGLPYPTHGAAPTRRVLLEPMSSGPWHRTRPTRSGKPCTCAWRPRSGGSTPTWRACPGRQRGLELGRPRRDPRPYSMRVDLRLERRPGLPVKARPELLPIGRAKPSKHDNRPFSAPRPLPSLPPLGQSDDWDYSYLDALCLSAARSYSPSRPTPTANFVSAARASRAGPRCRHVARGRPLPLRYCGRLRVEPGSPFAINVGGM